MAKCAYSQSYTDYEPYFDTNSHSDGDADCHTNSYPKCDSHADAGPDHAQCGRLLGKRATQSGSVLERRDFESGGRLPQRRVDRHHQE